MSFFKSLKRGLGFSDDDEAADDALFSDTTEPAATASDRDAAPAPAPEAPTFDPGCQNRIFDKVLDVFNRNLPPFLAASVDRDVQIRYLREALDEGVRDYMDSLGQAATAYCEARWQQTRESMAAELDSIKAKAGDIEKKSADMQQKQLSADRQRRALSDRVHDLESQIVRLEAEREQFELENRSLVNRLKVAGVQQEDVDSARTEIESLRLEIKRLRENPGEDSAQTDALRIQIDEMTEGMESLKEQTRVASAMLEETRKNLAAANRRIAERDSQLAEANSLIDQGNRAIEKKMQEVETVLAKNKEKIRLQKATIAERDAEILSLRDTIAENLRLQAAREKELQTRIDRLSPPESPARAVADSAAEPATVAPVISEADLHAIEKTFESEEWFTKTPPPETPSMRPDEDATDFGYSEPPRKHNNYNNPSQLSLFE